MAGGGGAGGGGGATARETVLTTPFLERSPRICRYNLRTFVT